MPTAIPDVRWAASLDAEARFRRLESEGLLFDPSRWETRLLTPVSAAVFEALLRSPATAQEVAEEVADMRLGVASPAETLGRVREILDELNRYELIRPCRDIPDADR